MVANYCASVGNNCGPPEGVVSVLLSNGDGTFGAPVSYDSGGVRAFSVAVGDVNGDGKLDLVVANGCGSDDNCNQGDGFVGVLLGNGDGTFQQPTSYDSGGFSAQSVALADTNGDGRLDIVVANECADQDCATGSVGVLLGVGDGTFKAALPYISYGYFAASVVVADVNGDGKPDLVVANQCGNSDFNCSDGTEGAVGVLLGNGDGTFRLSAVYNSGGRFSFSVAAGDLNDDGRLDLVVTNGSNGGSVGVLLGNGDGTFQSAVTYGAGGQAVSVAIGDLNADGHPDLLVANGDVGVLLGNGDGTFQAVLSYNSGGFEPSSVAIADVNADGKPDLLVANTFASNSNVVSGSVGVLLNVSTKGTSTALASSPNPSILSQSVTFTATVMPEGTGVPTGTVTFFDGVTPLGSPTLNASGVTTLSTSTLAVGSHSITAVYNGDANFGSSTSAVLSQVVQGAIAQISATGVNFGNQTVGIVSSSQTVSLTNTGNVALAITSIGIAGTNHGDFAQSNTCGQSVAPGNGCIINVTFTPTATGTRTANVTITDNAPNSPQMISLTGNGVLPAISLSPAKLIFSNQVVFTTSAAQTATLTNTGLGILNVSKIAATGPFAQTNTCGTSVAPGGTCAFTVTFKPTTIGTLTGAVSINDNAPTSPQKITLTGFGTYVQLSPTSLNFGNQPVGTKSLAKKVILSNKGSVAVSITSVSITGTDAKDFAQTNTCGKSVAAGASCFILVTFKPLTKGNRAAAVSVSDNGGGSPQTSSLAGTGT